MKVLAIDYGERKTGLALSDELGVVTMRLPVLFTQKEAHKLEDLFHLAGDLRPNIILFGLPQMNVGYENPQEKIVKEFAAKFEQLLHQKQEILGYIPKIVFWDESFSSKNAELGKSKKYKAEKSDSEAARLFLQEFLDSPDGLAIHRTANKL
jgi:putative Holliday junction resolvase